MFVEPQKHLLTKRNYLETLAEQEASTIHTVFFENRSCMYGSLLPAIVAKIDFSVCDISTKSLYLAPRSLTGRE